MNESDKQRIVSCVSTLIAATAIVMLWAMVVITKLSDTQASLTEAMNQNLIRIQQTTQDVNDLRAVLEAAVRRLDDLESRRK